MQLTVEARNLFVSFVELVVIEEMLRPELFLRGALVLEFHHLPFMFLNHARVIFPPFFKF